MGSQRLLQLNSRERNIVIGSILGDASIELATKSWRLQMAQGDKQKDYLIWKYQELKRWTKTPPRLVRFFDERYSKEYATWRFRTICHEEFIKLRNLFYPQGKKIVPKNIFSLIDHPLALAIWYMDDGGRRGDCHGMFLNTLCFSKSENEVLQTLLKKNFGIESRLHWVSDGFRIYIPSGLAAQEMCKIIGPYIIKSMLYKLPFDPVTTESAGLWRKR